MKNFKYSDLIHELRADDGDEGIVEGYIAVWDTIDSYNSRFQRGAFKKTLENRMHKIRVLWNHDTEQPIGKLLAIHEDGKGVFVRAKLTMSIQKAKDTFELIKDGAIDCFSFGFRIIKDKFENGVQVITEVMLGEISPVVFEANQASQITGIRSTGNELANAFDKYLKENHTNAEEVAIGTSFTVDELRSLESGKIIAEPNRLKELDEEIYQAYKAVRYKAVETLCDELRTGGFTSAERTRLLALINSDVSSDEYVNSFVSYMSDFRKKLNEDFNNA